MNTWPCGLGTCVLKPEGGKIGKVTNCLPVPGNVEYSSFGFESTPKLMSVTTACDSHVGVNCARGNATKPETFNVVSKIGLLVVNSRNAGGVPDEAYTASGSARSPALCPPVDLCKTIRPLIQPPGRCGSLASTTMFSTCEAPAASANWLGVTVTWA